MSDATNLHCKETCSVCAGSGPHDEQAIINHMRSISLDLDPTAPQRPPKKSRRRILLEKGLRYYLLAFIACIFPAINEVMKKFFGEPFGMVATFLVLWGPYHMIMYWKIEEPDEE